MIRKVYEVDPMVCPKCGETMNVIAFITEYAVVDRIIDHLEPAFWRISLRRPISSSRLRSRRPKRVRNIKDLQKILNHAFI
jgi:hypothetical protein